MPRPEARHRGGRGIVLHLGHRAVVAALAAALAALLFTRAPAAAERLHAHGVLARVPSMDGLFTTAFLERSSR